MPKEKVPKPPKNTPESTREWGRIIWYFLIGLAIVSVVSTLMTSPKKPNDISFTEFLNNLNNGKIAAVTIRTSERVIQGKTTAGKEFKTYFVEYPTLVQELRDHKVKVTINPSDSGWAWNMFIQAFLPFILIALLWFFIFRQAQGANNQALSFGKSRALAWQKKEGEKQITFKDVAGVDEAIAEVKEIVEFLTQPKKYQDIGAKIPKGVLLMGPPGTGKTLLAKAISGEANVPFFSIAGSDFVEMFVGVGASRVRDLFAQAKKNQPCIIFVDEIDAVGRHRGAGLGGGHDEREQTLNQLLVEMDGFDEKLTIIVIAATNRPDILDPALLRKGRFDRQIVVDKPDVKGRLDILKIHAQNRKISKDVDLDLVARKTPGFTGADLANLLNEAVLLAARYNKKEASEKEIDEATERVMAGPERKSRVINTKEKEIVAYHEVGHAIVAQSLPNADPVHKITILPRGMALGYTLQVPLEDKYLISKTEIEDQIKILMGGRIAEEIIFGSITSGASNDIERATEMARNYICQYGMNTHLGTRKYGKSSNYVFLGRDYGDHTKDYAEATAYQIDKEIQSLIETNYKAAKDILTKNKKALEKIAKVLIEREVLDKNEFQALFLEKTTKKKEAEKPKEPRRTRRASTQAHPNSRPNAPS